MLKNSRLTAGALMNEGTEELPRLKLHRQVAASSDGCQGTVAAPVAITGTGYVTGARSTVRFLPAPANTGIVFVRTDLPDRPRIPAHVAFVSSRERRTALSCHGATIEMTEHVLAALAGLGVDNCTIEIDASETPGMDGSSAPFVDAILASGIVRFAVPQAPLRAREPSRLADGDKQIAVLPGSADCLEIDYELDYGDVLGVGRQRLHVQLLPGVFEAEIARARTFILHTELDSLRRQGLGSGISAADLVVFGPDGQPIDNTLRFPDECVRHKILDILGDFALLGRPLVGRIVARRSGHRLNQAMVSQLSQAARMAA